MTNTAAAAEDLTDADYDLAQRILDALSERCGRDFTRSELARLAKVDTHRVEAALAALVADGNVSSTDRGAWSRFRFVWG